MGSKTIITLNTELFIATSHGSSASTQITRRNKQAIIKNLKEPFTIANNSRTAFFERDFLSNTIGISRDFRISYRIK